MRRYTLPAFILALVLVGIIFLLGHIGALNFFSNTTQKIFFPFSGFVHKTTSIQDSNVLKENKQLNQQLAQMQQIIADNKALRDQFQTTMPLPSTLIPAAIVAMPGVIPNVTFPDTLIVSVGKRENIVVGDSVVLQNSLVGLVTKVSDNFAEVTVVSSPKSSFSVKDRSTGAIGVARGQGNGEILVSNVQLSDTLSTNDIIVTLGNQNLSGQGIAPDLILGKITSVEKSASNLFQSARVVPLVQFDHLSMVFVSR